MTSQYKVLPLTFPFDCKRDVWEECVQEKDRIEPVFNRDGWYLDRYTGKTWLEINGEAWLYSNRGGFQFDLDTSVGNNWMDEETFRALTLLCRRRVTSNARLRHMQYIETCRRGLAKVRRDSTLAALGFRRKTKSRIPSA